MADFGRSAPAGLLVPTISRGAAIRTNINCFQLVRGEIAVSGAAISLTKTGSVGADFLVVIIPSYRNITHCSFCCGRADEPWVELHRSIQVYDKYGVDIESHVKTKTISTTSSEKKTALHFFSVRGSIKKNVLKRNELNSISHKMEDREYFPCSFMGHSTRIVGVNRQ